jgi:REP element-mobilizing transposase RayT
LKTTALFIAPRLGLTRHNGSGYSSQIEAGPGFKDEGREILMSRRSKIINPENPIHISSRCINRDWFEQDLDSVWLICEDYLWMTAKLYNLKIHSFVLMSNHYHLLASAPDGNLSHAMQYLNREISRNILKSSKRINLTFGGRFFRSEITSFQHFMSVYKYVYRNPVQASICSWAEAYKYSTLAGLLGSQKMLIPLEYDTLLFDPAGIESCLKWLNTAPKNDDYLTMKKALRRQVFKIPRNSQNKSHRLDSEGF